MQKFRPEPNPNNMEDPWYASRLPEQTMQSHERLAAPAATYGYPELPMSGPYGTMYPQDQLSQIKMRNRRFMNACAQEMYMGGNMGMMGPQPGMMMQPPPMMWGPPTLDHEMAHDELSVSLAFLLSQQCPKIFHLGIGKSIFHGDPRYSRCLERKTIIIQQILYNRI